MNETGSASLKKRRPLVVSRREKLSRQEATIMCGSVTIKGVGLPSVVEVQRNVVAGQMALSRAKNAFLKPGIRIRAGKNVPLFSVDPGNPSVLVRLLNGKRERGVVKNGAFEVCQ